MQWGSIVIDCSEINKKSYFDSVIRFFMLTIIIPFFFSLSSCALSDTTDPGSVSTVSYLGSREAASILNTEGFENERISKFWHTELRTFTAGVLEKGQAREGNQALRFSWMPSQYDGTNPTMHSELATNPLTNGEAERWYGYSVYMPSSTMADDSDPVIFSQWHGVPDPGFSDTVPPIAFWLESNNKITMSYRASNKPIYTLLQHPTSQKTIDLGTASFDRWVDYVLHVKWDPSGNQGVLEVWQDGKLVVNEQTISIGYPQISKPFWKIGLYAWTGKASHKERALLYDDIRIGGPSAGYDDVKPGRANNSACERQ